MKNSMIMRKRLNKERRALLKKSKIKYEQENWTNNELVCKSVPSATPTTRRSAPPSMTPPARKGGRRSRASQQPAGVGQTEVWSPEGEGQAKD